MKRRSFFKSFAGVIAAVALAPEIAFNVRIRERWKSSELGIYSQLQRCNQFDILVGTDQKLKFEHFFAQLYAVRSTRKNDHIEIIIHEDSVPMLKSLL